MAVLTAEQDMVRDAARSWAQDRSPVTALRRLRDSGDPLGFNAESWREQAELGWPGVIIPEEYGGVDVGYFAMGLILEEMGRTLTASPLLASGLGAASALLLGGSAEQKKQWLPGIADGSIIATLALDEGHRHAPDQVAATAVKAGSAYRLDGRKTFVLEGPAANMLIVSARMPGAGERDVAPLGLFIVDMTAGGISRTPLRTIDSRGVANVGFDDVHAELLGEAGRGEAVLEAVLDRVRIGLSAEMLGAASQAFDITLDYLKTREQFGQPIGAFQALQHRAARLFAELELARSAVEAALQAIDDGASTVAELASLAKARMGDTLHLVSNEMIQLHGGIGMTDEHDAGFFLKRARTCEAAFGNRAFHRERYGRLLGY